MEDRANKPTAGDHPMTSRSIVSRWGNADASVAKVSFGTYKGARQDVLPIVSWPNLPKCQESDRPSAATIG